MTATSTATTLLVDFFMLMCAGNQSSALVPSLTAGTGLSSHHDGTAAASGSNRHATTGASSGTGHGDGPSVGQGVYHGWGEWASWIDVDGVADHYTCDSCGVHSVRASAAGTATSCLDASVTGIANGTVLVPASASESVIGKK